MYNSDGTVSTAAVLRGKVRIKVHKLEEETDVLILFPTRERFAYTHTANSMEILFLWCSTFSSLLLPLSVQG